MIEPTDQQLKEFIHQSNLIEDIDDQEADNDSYEAWAELETVKELDNVIICKLQRIITRHQTDLHKLERGYYRDMAKIDVHVGGMVAPTWYMVPFLMDNWLLDYADPTKNYDPKKAHINFEHIHPFADGNGRTGRMLMNWQRLHKDLELLIIENATKSKKYYTWF